MAEQYANFAETTLDGAINNSTTSIVVTDGSVFPATGNFRIVIDTEIMLCTARSTNTLTVTRGQESSAADSHADLAPTKSPITKQSFLNLITDNILAGAASARPAASQPGRLYYPSDAPVILRDTGSLWVPYGPVHKLKNPNDYASWSYGRNNGGGGTSWTVQEFTQTIKLTTVGSSGIGFEAVKRAAPTAPYKITALFQNHNMSNTYQQIALGFRHTSDDKVTFIRFCLQNGANSHFVFRTYANGWDQSSEGNTSNWPVLPENTFWLQIEDNNTNHYFRYSMDGINWVEILNESRTARISSSADYVWWGLQLFGSGELSGVSLLSWLEE